MKQVSLILGCLAFALCPLVQAQPTDGGPTRGGGRGGAGGPGGGRGGRQGMQKMWEQVDRDELFSSLDADGDGTISKAEFTEANLGEIIGGAVRKAMMAGRQGGGQQGRDPAERFKQMDKDADGKITAEEFPAGPEVFERFVKRADKDGDGALSMEEMSAMRGRGRGGEGGGRGGEGGKGGGRGGQGNAVQRFDKNGDGKISAEEFPRGKEAFEKILKNADKDGDGLLSAEEMAGARGGGRRGGGK